MASDERPASSVASDEAVGQREYLIAPRDVDGASGWVETRPDYPLPRMCIVARRGRLTNAAVGEFLQFLGDALALQAPMTVLWDVSSEPGGFPSMEQFRTVNRWLAQNGRAAAYDACVQGHCLFVKQRLRRLGIRTMASIARPPQPVKVVASLDEADLFAAEARCESDGPPPPPPTPPPPLSPASREALPVLTRERSRRTLGASRGISGRIE